MGGAPEPCDQKRQDDDADSEIAALDQRFEPSALPLGGRRARESARRAGAAARLEPHVRGGHIEGRAQQLRRIRLELVASTLRRDVGTHQARPVAGADNDLLPADPGGEVLVAEQEIGGCAWLERNGRGLYGAIERLEAHRRQSSCSRPP